MKGDCPLEPAKSPARYTVDTDKDRLDVEVIHRFLTNSYWAAGIPLDIVRKSIANSLCFGVYEGQQQVGFARVVSDYSTFAYVADVFILESHRGSGLAKRLMAAILMHPDLNGLRNWVLATRDAHGLYARFGFRPLASPERFMEMHDSTAYSLDLF